MRSLFLSCLVCICLATQAQPQAQPSRHVIVISIDGLRPEMYLDPSRPTPNLQQLMKEGSYALKMKSVFPSYTYPAHASMLTGAFPATHQVCYNAPFEPVGSSGRWNWEASLIKARTIWDAAKDAGLSTASVNWPVSLGAPVTWIIPEVWPIKDGEDRISEARKFSTPGLVEEIEKGETGPLTKENMNEEWPSMDENSGRMAAYIFRTYKPRLLTLHYAGVDGREHDEGREGPKVPLALEAVDRSIGYLLETVERAGLKDSTTILIVGDHGHMNFHSVLRPNIWLAKQGLLHSGAQWRVKFQPAGGSAFLYLQNPGDTAALGQVKRLLQQAPASYRRLFRVIDKDELIKMGADRNAVLALAAEPGIVFGGASEGELLVGATGGHHGYDPNFPEMFTGFIAAGSGINKGLVIPELCVVDMAPLLAKLLGIEFQAPDGVLVAGLIKKQ